MLLWLDKSAEIKTVFMFFLFSLYLIVFFTVKFVAYSTSLV